MNRARPVARCATIVQVLESLFYHFRSVLRVGSRQKARVLDDSLLFVVGSILILVECAGIPEDQASGLDVERAFAVFNALEVVVVDGLPVLCSCESSQFHILSMEQMRPLIDDERSRLVFSESHETLDTLEVTVVRCLVSVRPDFVSLASAAWNPATAVETGNEFISSPDFAEWCLDCVACADEPSVFLVADFAELEDSVGVNGVVQFNELCAAVNPVVEVFLGKFNLVWRENFFDDGVSVGGELLFDVHGGELLFIVLLKRISIFFDLNQRQLIYKNVWLLMLI